jgi:hypothetical protein
MILTIHTVDMRQAKMIANAARALYPELDFWKDKMRHFIIFPFHPNSSWRQFSHQFSVCGQLQGPTHKSFTQFPKVKREPQAQSTSCYTKQRNDQVFHLASQSSTRFYRLQSSRNRPVASAVALSQWHPHLLLLFL